MDFSFVFAEISVLLFTLRMFYFKEKNPQTQFMLYMALIFMPLAGFLYTFNIGSVFITQVTWAGIILWELAIIYYAFRDTLSKFFGK